MYNEFHIICTLLNFVNNNEALKCTKSAKVLSVLGGSILFAFGIATKVLYDLMPSLGL